MSIKKSTNSVEYFCRATGSILVKMATGLIRGYRELIEVDTNFEGDFSHKKGTSLYNSGEYEEAVSYLKKAIEHEPGKADLYYKLGGFPRKGL